MSVFKDFPRLENLEKIQGLSRTRKSPADINQIVVLDIRIPNYPVHTSLAATDAVLQ